MEEGDSAAAESALRDALERCRTIGYRHGEAAQLVNLANLCYAQGRVADALTAYDEASVVFAELEQMLVRLLEVPTHRLVVVGAGFRFVRLEPVGVLEVELRPCAA